jgi:HlyD family secretion protein
MKKKSSKKTLWFILGGVALLLIVVVLMKGSGGDDITEVATEKVSKRMIIETVNASGKVYPEIEVKVSPDISGEIVELNVQEGDSVKRGQILARIYADIYTSERDRANAAVAQSQAQVANSSASLESFKVRLQQAEVQYERQKRLYEEKVISRSEYEQAETTMKTAQADLAAAAQNIRSGQASVQSAQTGLVIANKNLGRATLVAPMDGVVSLLTVKKGERVVGTAQMAGTEMMRVADMNRIEVRVDVSENDIPKVHLGDSALVEVDAYNNRKFKGIVTQIASSSTNATSLSSGSNDITNYKVHIRLLPESFRDLFDPGHPKSFPFRPGMSASADIQTKRRPDAVAVPINAVTTRDKDSTAKDKKKPVAGEEEKAGIASDDDLETVVFVLQKDGTVKKVKVKTDIQDINYIEITDGLKVDDEVVTGPYSVVTRTLKNGMKVKIKPKEKDKKATDKK